MFYGAIIIAAILSIFPPVSRSILPPTTPSVRLAWDYSLSPEVVAYRVYWGSAPSSYTNFVQVGNTNTATVTGLQYGLQYHFSATALNLAGDESDFCEPVAYALPLPKTNTLLRFGVRFEQSTNLTDWTAITNIEVLTLTNPAGNGFFRSKATYQKTNY